MSTEIGDYFQAQLRKLAERHSSIIDVRGKGLMIAAELDSADLAKHAVTEMLKRRILINCTSDTVLRFLPPYIFERAHVDTAIAALDKVFTAYTAAQAAVPSSEEDKPWLAKLSLKHRSIPVEKDPDILAAAARLDGEDMCSIADLIQRRGARHSQARPRRQAQSRASIAMRSTPSRWC